MTMAEQNITQSRGHSSKDRHEDVHRLTMTDIRISPQGQTRGQAITAGTKWQHVWPWQQEQKWDVWLWQQGETQGPEKRFVAGTAFDKGRNTDLLDESRCLVKVLNLNSLSVLFYFSSAITFLSFLLPSLFFLSLFTSLPCVHNIAIINSLVMFIY